MVPLGKWGAWPHGLILALLAAAAWPAIVRADGWHNAALATSSLDQWLNQNFATLKSTMPNLKEQLEASEVRAGRDYEALQELANKAAAAADNKGAKPKTPPGRAGTITNKLTPQQQALIGKKAADCLEILGCMNPQNIYPREFPTFQMEQIPKYRDAAKNLLKMMGPPGARAVTSQLRSELMGVSPVGNLGLTPHPDYYRDLLAVLKEHVVKGTASLDDLSELEKAASGLKDGPQKVLALEIQKTLEGMENVSIPTILEWAETTDLKRRAQWYGKVRARLKEASVSDLIAIGKSKVDVVTKDAAKRELEGRWSSAGILDLLGAMESVDEAQTRKLIAAALAERSPKYADVKEDLPEIWKHARSENNRVAAAAREQMVNAFLRAPISECLEWLSQNDAELNKLIWEQLDDRIARADAARKAGYRDVALAALGENDLAIDQRLAAMDLLSRLKDKQAAGEVIEMLPLLPLDMRPRAGKLLRDLTGQNFGPFPGDGTAEVTVALKKWQDWWKQNGTP